jgi:hypothetical protein
VATGAHRALLAGLAVGLILLPTAAAATGSTTRMSIPTGGGQADGRSFVPAISADGRYAAFYSDASNLVSGDANGARDVFIRDRQTGETTRASVDGAGAEANDDSFEPAISADGRFVAFSSSATNLVAGDSNEVNDVFVRDRQANTTTRVSVGLAGANANGGSDSPSISGDGRLVAFKRLGRANCRVGTVRRARAKPKKAGKVISQSPRARSVRARNAKVNLVVGRR